MWAEIIKYGALFIGVIALQIALTPIITRWFRNLPEKERESLNKQLNVQMKIDRVVWRFIFMPIIATIAIYIAYLFLTGKL